MQLTKMTDDELKEIALQKNKKGCATSEALRAQKILRQRNNSFIDCGSQANFSSCGSVAWGSND